MFLFYAFADNEIFTIGRRFEKSIYGSSFPQPDKCDKGRLIIPVKSCDSLLRPTHPWQRGANKNINGPIRQYLPRRDDLSVYSQEELDAIVFGLNMRPRKRFELKCSIEVMS